MWDWLRNAAGAVLRALPGVGTAVQAYDNANRVRKVAAQQIRQSPQLQARVPQPVQRAIQQPQIPKLNIRDLQRALNPTNITKPALGVTLGDIARQVPNAVKQVPNLAPLGVRDIFDANTQADKKKRQKAGEPTDYFQQQKEIYGNNRPYQNVAAMLAGGTARFINTGGAAINEAVDTARVQFASPEMKSAYMKILDENQKARFAQNSGLLGQGTWFDSQQDYQKTAADPLALLQRAGLSVAETALERASFGLGGARNKLAEQGAKQFIKTGAKKAGIRAVEGAASDVAGQQFQRDKWSPEQTAYSALGAAGIPLAAAGAGKVVRIGADQLGKISKNFVANMPARTQGGFIDPGAIKRDAVGRFSTKRNAGKVDATPEDQNTLINWLDSVNSDKKLSNADFIALENEVERIAKLYKIPGYNAKNSATFVKNVGEFLDNRVMNRFVPPPPEPTKALTIKYNKVEVPIEQPKQGIIKRTLAKLKANMPERTQGGYIKVPGLGDSEVPVKPKLTIEQADQRPKGTLNTARLAVTADQAQDIASRQLPDTSVLSDAEVKQLAKSVGIDLRSNSIEQTREKIAKQLNTRNEIVDLERQADALRKSGDKVALGNVYRELRELSQASTKQGTDIARQLSARRIVADATKTPTQRMFLLLDKAGVNPDVYIPKAVNVDFNNANEALKFYRELVPAKASDWIDLVRYNSMLSSPLTQIVNLSSTGANISMAPLERTITSNLDFIDSLLTGKPRKYAGGEGRAYAAGMVESFPQAVASFKQSIKGLEENINVDAGLQGGHIPISAVGQNKVVDVLDFPMRVLGAFDNFNRALVAGGSDKALKRRISKGIKVVNPEAENTSEAAYRTFNMEIGDKSQGYLLSGIDELTGLVMKARASKNPVLGNVAKWTLPFVRIGANLMKQGIEYSPAGIATVAGATRKTEQVAKAMIGTAVFGTAAGLLGQDRLTWAEPTDPEQKKAFRAAGLQPYSMKIGDKWIGFQKLPPVISFNFAMVAAIDDARKNASLNDNGVDNIVTAISKYGNFMSDQSYLKNIGDTLAAIKGDPEKLTQLIGNYPQQAIPFRALSGWIARMTDDTQRKVNTDAGFAQKQIENLMQQIPGLRQKTTARVDEQGNPIASQYPVLNAFSPTQVSKENPEARQAYDIKVARLATNSKEKANIDKLKKAYLEGDASAAAALTKEQRKAADKSKKEDEIRKNLTPVENQLWAYSKEDLEAMKNGSNGEAVKRVLSLKGSLGSTKATNPKEAYEQALEKYNQDKQDGTISSIGDISRSKSLKKLQVAANYDQDTVDLYGLSGKELNAYLKGDKNGGALWKKVVEYDQALYNAGTISKPKFRDSKGNLYIPGTRGKKGRKGRKAKLAKATKARAIKKVSIRKLKSSSPRTVAKRSVPVLKAKKPTRRKITLST